jgi:NAD kinase
MRKSLPIIAVVTRDTRLQNLKERWVTSSNVQFRMQQAASHEENRLQKKRKKQFASLASAELDLMVNAAAEALSDDDDLRDEDQTYAETLKRLMYEIDFGFPIKKVDRDYIANFDFGRCIAVVVFGQDGLVANVAKYVGDVPIIGINPDATRHDGILLPFNIDQARNIVRRAVDQKANLNSVTLAEVTTNDGQRMMAFNDFFLGCKTHTSARYTVELNLQTESQSSSGLIVSTGAGSTGWMSSLFNMAERLGKIVEHDHQAPSTQPKIQWSDDKLIWAVREPFISRHSSADMIGGLLSADEELVVGSQMDGNGVIFSDGIENDFIEFNSGSIAAFRVANQKAQLVVS